MFKKNYKNDKLDGIYKEYYENGQLSYKRNHTESLGYPNFDDEFPFKSEETYESGLKEGLVKYY